jgi:flagellar biosynthetic protein FliR
MMSMLDALQQVLTHLGFQVTVEEFLVLFGLAFARLLPVFVWAPFLGGGSVPRQAKVGLAFIMVAVMYSGLTENVAAGPITTMLFVGLLVKEALIGVSIALAAQLVFYAVQTAGTIIDTQRGMNQATFFSPQLPGNASLLGQLKFQAALALFLAIDGHLLFVRALYRSFTEVPLLVFPRFQAGVIPLIEQVTRMSANVLLVALQLSAPVLLALFLVDVAFASLGKVVPQVHVHFESQTVKSLVGLGMVFLVLGLFIERLQGYLLLMLREVSELSKALV